MLIILKETLSLTFHLLRQKSGIQEFQQSNVLRDWRGGSSIQIEEDDSQKWESTKSRWEERLVTLGHYRQCCRTRNRRVTVLCDHDCILLALYRVAFPKPMAVEINSFLYRANFGNLDFQFYALFQIIEYKNHIGLMSKRESTTAFQALLPVNWRKRWCYCNLL